MKILNVKRVKTISKSQQRSISGRESEEDCIHSCLNHSPYDDENVALFKCMSFCGILT